MVEPHERSCADTTKAWCEDWWIGSRRISTLLCVLVLFTAACDDDSPAAATTTPAASTISAPTTATSATTLSPATPGAPTTTRAPATTVDPSLVRIRTTRSCFDIEFFGYIADNTIAVHVEYAASTRTAPLEVEFDLATDPVRVTVEHGARLDEKNYSCFVIQTETPPERIDSTSPGIAGTGTLRLGPPGCPTTAFLRLDGLVAEDGTAFAPIISHGTNMAGCAPD